MKFAVIAAGEGSRLKQEGIIESKPLIRLGGEYMLSRLIRIFTKQEASEIIVIVNPQMPDVAGYAHWLKDAGRATCPCTLTVLEKTTPSSMHSFFEMSSFLGKEPFCLTTVDTIFREEDFGNFINAFHSFTGDALMAVTDYIDDEKPLYVKTVNDMTISGFYDTANNCTYVSGGIYCMKPSVMPTLYKCIAEGQSRMRNFQRQLLADGLAVKAWPFSKIIDVDHSADIMKAELFLQTK